MLTGVGRTIVALVAITSIGVASAQPVPETSPREGARPESSGGVKIPVTMQPGGEVLGDELVSPPHPRQPSIEHPIDPKTYVCGPSDVFELEFWGSQNLHLTLTTDLEGRVFVPKIGFVPVAGKTLAVVRTAMTAKLRAIYPGLNFDLTLSSPRTFIVHVVGNVKDPGTYSSQPLERVSSVIGRAGGGGSRRRIAIQHRDGTATTADLVRYELTGDVTANPFLLDGDVVTVPIAKPVVTIGGAVYRPGRYELIAGQDIAELLELAGGFTSAVSRALPFRLIRRNDRQQQTLIDLPFTGDTPPNAPLRDDDQLIVRGSDELQRSVQIIGAVVGADSLDAATSSRRVPFLEGDTVMSLFERIGGIKTAGDLRRSYISRPRRNQPAQVIAIDLEALLIRRDFSADRPVKLDDTIVVPPMQYSVLIEGAVARAGLYHYNPTFGITEYIAHAGGRSRTAQEIEDVVLIDAAGKTHAFRPDIKPAPGDAILVPERSFSRAEVAQLILAAAGIVISGIAVTIAASK